jgi:hypothetical protein
MLAELESLFWQAARGEASPLALRQAFVSRGALSAVDRLRIYERMYFVRQEQALRDGFPKLAAQLGSRFRPLVRDYLRTYPSQAPLLEQLGRALEHFLRAAGESPLHADLAALEWARTQAFLAADGRGRVGPADVVPETFAAATLGFVPALKLCTIGAGALELWKAASPLCVEPGAATPVIVFRKKFSVLHRALTAAEARALELALAGETMAHVCATFGDDQQAATCAFRVIASWMNHGLVEEIRPASR